MNSSLPSGLPWPFANQLQHLQRHSHWRPNSSAKASPTSDPKLWRANFGDGHGLPKPTKSCGMLGLEPLTWKRESSPYFFILLLVFLLAFPFVFFCSNPFPFLDLWDYEVSCSCCSLCMHLQPASTRTHVNQGSRCGNRNNRTTHPPQPPPATAAAAILIANDEFQTVKVQVDANRCKWQSSRVIANVCHSL